MTHVTILRKHEDPNSLRGYAFVHFAERAHALRVLAEVENGHAFEMDGSELKVHMARPQVRLRLCAQSCCSCACTVCGIGLALHAGMGPNAGGWGQPGAM